MSIRHIAVHEPIEGLMRVDHDEIARSLCLVGVNQARLQLLEDADGVSRGRNDDRRMGGDKTLRQKSGDRVAEVVVVAVKLHGVVVIEERFRHGLVITSRRRALTALFVTCYEPLCVVKLVTFPEISCFWTVLIRRPTAVPGLPVSLPRAAAAGREHGRPRIAVL